MSRTFFCLLIGVTFLRFFSSLNINDQSRFAQLSSQEQIEAMEAFKNGTCEYKGITLHGKVKFVTSFPDIKVKYVDAFPDINVKFVSSFPKSCGEWQVVSSFPDFTVQVVEAFPDLKVKKVASFPGMN